MGLQPTFEVGLWTHSYAFFGFYWLCFLVFNVVHLCGVAFDKLLSQKLNDDLTTKDGSCRITSTIVQQR